MNETETTQTNDFETEKKSPDATRIACLNAAKAMLFAMEAQNECRTACMETEAKLETGLFVEESDKKMYEEKKEAGRRAVQAYRDSHILAHRTACAEQLLQYRKKDGATLLRSAPFSYDRDPVDAAIADSAMEEWVKTGKAKPGKNYLLVESCTLSDDLSQLFVSNTHSPIPISEAVSKKMETAFGDPVYQALNPNARDYQNALSSSPSLAPVTPAATIGKTKKVPAKAAEETSRLAKPKRYVRVYQDDPNPYRTRTAAVSDILYEEREKRGVRLSPDPARELRVEKKREKTVEATNVS